MIYDYSCPFEDCLHIEFRLTSEPLVDGFYIELFVTEEDNQIVLYGRDSRTEREDCICAQGALPVLRELVESIRIYSSLKKEELITVYERTLNYLLSKLVTQETIEHFMKVFRVNTTVDVVESMLINGKLDWLQEW